MQSNPTKPVSPRLSYAGSGTVLAHVLDNAYDPRFRLMQYEPLTKGFENVPNTPHHRLLATWLWDMITFTMEMTYNEANYSQTVGIGLASACLKLRNLNQEKYTALT